MLIFKKHSTLENTRSLRVAYCNNDDTIQMLIMTIPLKCNNDDTTQMYAWKYSFELKIRLEQKYEKWKIKIPYSLGNGWFKLLLWNKEILYSEKKISLQLNTATYYESCFFTKNYFFLWAAISLWILHIYQHFQE